MSSTRLAPAEKLESKSQAGTVARSSSHSYSGLRDRLIGLRNFRPTSLTSRYSIALAPALVMLITTAFVDFAPVNPGSDTFLFWTPIETVIWISMVFAGVIGANYRDLRLIRGRLDEANKNESDRRQIAAIGMAASWDLDLNRLYQRVSQDLRSILEFDRFTITAALPTGQMRIEFVSGEDEEGYPSGAILPDSPDEPDGLFADYRHKYASRLTAAIPACNGTLTIRSYSNDQYSPGHLDLLRQAVAQISPGIANAIIFQASERRLRERTVLAEIGRAATSAVDPKETIQAVDSSLMKLINYDHLGVILTDEKDAEPGTGLLIYWSKSGLSGWEEGENVPFDSTTSNQGMVIAGYGPDFANMSTVETDQEVNHRVWLQAPLFVQEKLIGLLVLSSTEHESFGQEESALLLNVSLQIAPAIQNANLTATLKRQADERQIIAAIGLAANSELNLDVIYKGVADELARVLQFDRLTMSHIRDADGQNEVVYSTGIQIDGFGVGKTIPFRNSEALYYDNNRQDWSASSPGITSMIERSGLRSRASAPLGTAPQILGRLHIASLQEDAYSPEDVALLQQIAIQVTPAIRNAKMIAAERELRETLDRQNQELYEANNARKQFLSTVSHELKTPLTIISGYVDLLASSNELDDEEDRQETFGIIRRNADHLNILINDILDISRMDAGTFTINPQPFSVNGLVSDLEASFQSLLRTKTQTLAVDMADDEVWVNADRARISQVITNLLSNASKFSPENTEVSLSCHIDGERLRVTVADHGEGMTKEEQTGLFTAFFRADNELTRKVPGTGLGLMIAKSITELHGGEIRLTSQPGHGTTIEFWLPDLTTKEAADVETVDEQPFAGSRLWPEGPPDDIGLGAD